MANDVGNLVLSRKVGESICIGDLITVKVLEVRSGQVRLSVSAPRDIPIHREEVQEAIRRQQGNLS